ncbi:Transposase DDE domain-containing protein [Paenibacillus naphthalenovorans]|nr:transposase [Paenibacillus naphthalenovorans]SDI74298.1 Transposase DDE domain-containing protein [Paenibacillus naphthalenovorans]
MKPGYNVLIGTENQFIVGYSLHQRPTDTRCLKPHLEKVKAALGKLPDTVIADAGYGGEENYAYLEQEEVQAIVKYSTYHKEKSKKWQLEVGWLSFAHNLLKWATMNQKGRVRVQV